MDSKLDFHVLSGYVNHLSLPLASVSPQTRVISKSDAVLLSNAEFRKKFAEEAAIKNIRIKQVAKKLNRTTAPTQEDYEEMNWLKIGPLVGEKQIILAKMNRKPAKPQLEKKENAFRKVCQVSTLNESPFIKSKQQLNNRVHLSSRVNSVSLNSRPVAKRNNQENLGAIENGSQKKQDKYNHFKKTISSFWPKNPGFGENELLFHQRCNSAAFKTHTIFGQAKEIDENKEQENKILRKTNTIQFLPFNRINLNQRIHAASAYSSPKALEVSQSSKPEKVSLLSIDRRSPTKHDETSRNDSAYYYASHKPVQTTESKYMNDGDSSLRNESSRYRETVAFSLSSNEYPIRASPQNLFNPKKIEEDLYYESYSSRRNTPRKSNYESPQPPYSNALGGQDSSSGSNKIKRKLKETVNSEAESKEIEVVPKKEIFTLISARDLKKTSKYDKMTSLYGALESSEAFQVYSKTRLNMGEKKRSIPESKISTVQIDTGKYERYGKSDNGDKPNKILATVEDFEIKGWGQEAETHEVNQEF